MTDLLKAVEAPANPNIPDLRPGDAVSVHVRIKEGDRERIQEFKGTVIRLRSGNGGQNGNFTVRRIASNGVGVERTFLLRSPRIQGCGGTSLAGSPRPTVLHARPFW